MNESDDSDLKEFCAFYDAYQDRIFGFTRWMGLSYQDAEDVLNDTFLAIWRYWRRVDETDRFSYTYGIARHAVYGRWNGQRARLEDLAAVPPTVTARDFAQEIVDHQALGRALAELSDREREAVLLRYYAGFSVAETARIMDNISSGAVKRYAADGLKKLKRTLGGNTMEGENHDG